MICFKIMKYSLLTFKNRLLQLASVHVQTTQFHQKRFLVQCSTYQSVAVGDAAGFSNRRF